MYAHFLYSTSCHKHFCKVNEQNQARRVEHSLYLPCCLKEVRIFDCVFSSLLLHSAWCSHVLQKDRSVLFITFIPLSPKYPSVVCSGSCFYPVSTPARFLPLSQGTKVIFHARGCFCPWCSPQAALGSADWDGAFTHLWNVGSVCGWLVGWFFLSLVFTVFFLWLNKAAPIVGAALLRWHWKGFQAAPAELNVNLRWKV